MSFIQGSANTIATPRQDAVTTQQHVTDATQNPAKDATSDSRLSPHKAGTDSYGWNTETSQTVQTQKSVWWNRNFFVGVGHALQGFVGLSAFRSAYLRGRGETHNHQGLMLVRYDPRLTTPGPRTEQRTREQAQFASHAELGGSVVGFPQSAVGGLLGFVAGLVSRVFSPPKPDVAVTTEVAPQPVVHTVTPLDYLRTEFDKQDVSGASIREKYDANIEELANYLKDECQTVEAGLTRVKELRDSEGDEHEPDCVKFHRALVKCSFGKEFATENCDFELAVALLHALHPKGREYTAALGKDVSYIFNTFVSDNAARQININSHEHTQLTKLMKTEDISGPLDRAIKALAASQRPNESRTDRQTEEFRRLDPLIRGRFPPEQEKPVLHIADIFGEARRQNHNLSRDTFRRLNASMYPDAQRLT